MSDSVCCTHARFQIPPIMGAARSYSVMTPFPIGAGLTEVNFGTALCTYVRRDPVIALADIRIF